MPDRTIHLIDLENLVGGAVTSALADACYAAYSEHVPVADIDHVVVATNPGAGLAAGMAFGSSARLRVGHGADGADLALLEVLKHEQLENRYDRVVIASGDGIFAETAAALAADVNVVAVSRPGSLSRHLRMAVHSTVPFILHPDHDTAIDALGKVA